MTLAAGLGECQRLLEETAEEAHLPGLIAAGFVGSTQAWKGSAGAVGAQYRIGSITKTFTAVAVLQLRDEGRLELTDPVGRHVVDAPHGDRSVGELLAHSAGITAEPRGEWWERTPGRTWAVIAASNTRDPVFPAQQRHHYSNLGYAILGELVARLRNQPWFEAIAERILARVGLTETSYLPREDAAPGTSRDPWTGIRYREPAHDAEAMAPAGQLWSTTADLARWGDVLVNGYDGVLSSGTAKEMRTVHAADPDTQHRGGYGLGLRLHWRPGSTLVGHTGSMPGFLAGLFCDASSGVGAVILANATTGFEPERLCAALVDRLEPVVAGAPSGAGDRFDVERPQTSPATGLAGEWFWGNTLMPLQPTPAGFLLGRGAEARAFRFVEKDRYVGVDGYFAGESLRVHRDRAGDASHLEVVTFVFTRRPYDPTAPIPGGLPEPL